MRLNSTPPQPSTFAWIVRRLALPLGIVIALATTIAINHDTSSSQRRTASAATTPSYHIPPQVRRHLTLGYNNALAVLYWFGVISDFGGKLADETNYDAMAERLDTITLLDPYAEQAYYTAATVLTWQLHSTRLSGPLLDRGIKMMPQEWRWPYYRGFYSYFFDNDAKTAAKLMAIAVQHPDVPPILIRLATKMRAEQAGLDTALLFLQQLLKKKQDPAMTEKIKLQMDQIRTEKILRQLDRVLAKIPNWQGDPHQLQRLGIRLPQTLPDGGHITFDHQQRPISSAQKKRYQLFQSPAYLRRQP